MIAQQRIDRTTANALFGEGGIEQPVGLFIAGRIVHILAHGAGRLHEEGVKGHFVAAYGCGNVEVGDDEKGQESIHGAQRD